MKTDFLDAFNRHWQDAETLFELRRWANAEYLHGMAAECALKRLMQCFGMRLNDTKDRPEKQEDRKHINEIWKRYPIYLSGHFGRAFALPPCEPFKDWRVGQRYCHQENFTEARAAGHRDGAALVKRFIDKARLEGLL